MIQAGSRQAPEANKPLAKGCGRTSSSRPFKQCQLRRMARAPLSDTCNGLLAGFRIDESEGSRAARASARNRVLCDPRSRSRRSCAKDSDGWPRVTRITRIPRAGSIVRTWPTKLPAHENDFPRALQEPAVLRTVKHGNLRARHIAMSFGSDKAKEAEKIARKRQPAVQQIE